MQNLLIDPLPQNVEIDGKLYPINTDFRISLLFGLLMEDATITEEEKIYKSLDLYYPIPPHCLEKAAKEILIFYHCGKKEPAKKGSGEIGERIYHIDWDAPYLYAAFLQQYKIDLTVEQLHWWKFQALFQSLSPDTMFMKIIGYRNAKIDAKAPPEEKKRLEKLKRQYALPREYRIIENQHIKEVEYALLHGGNLRGML